jgi:hypothetical protein
MSTGISTGTGMGMGETHPHVHGGPPVLDIGGDVGALVATMDSSAVGTELHLRSEHEPPISIHTGVWRRAVVGGSRNEVTAAVFAELLEGTYWALDRNGHELVCVDIRGGELTSIDLRDWQR